MVVSSMTFYEIYEELASDNDKIKIKRQQLENKAVRKFKKTAKFPAWELFEYRIPSSGNSYILYFYAENRLSVEKPVFDVFAIMFDKNNRLVVKWGCSPYQHTPSDPMIATRIVNIYTNHFFQRYMERILKNPELSVNEVVCRYLTRNPNALLMKLNEKIMKNYQDYGETAKHGMKVRDGICLTRSLIELHFDQDTQKDNVDAIGNLYVTFINDGTLTDTQNEAVQKENIRYSKELIETLIANFTNRETGA